MKRILIVVAGGSASGKSSVVSEIKKNIKEDVVFIHHDDYYKNQDHLPFEERIKTNYDHPDALENDLLVEHLNALLNGKAIDKPVYDFTNHTRKKEIEHVEPKKVIILEGILTLEDERIRNLADIKVYVNCDDDLRFIRRLQRDVNERGRSVDSVVKQYLNTVRPMHQLFVRPTIRYADIIIPNDIKHSVATGILIRSIRDLINEVSN